MTRPELSRFKSTKSTASAVELKFAVPRKTTQMVVKKTTAMEMVMKKTTARALAFNRRVQENDDNDGDGDEEDYTDMEAKFSHIAVSGKEDRIDAILTGMAGHSRNLTKARAAATADDRKELKVVGDIHRPRAAKDNDHLLACDKKILL